MVQKHTHDPGPSWKHSQAKQRTQQLCSGNPKLKYQAVVSNRFCQQCKKHHLPLSNSITPNNSIGLITDTKIGMFLRTPPKRRTSKSKNNRTTLPSFAGREWQEHSQDMLVVKSSSNDRLYLQTQKKKVRRKLSFSRRREGGGWKSMTYMKSSTNLLPH